MVIFMYSVLNIENTITIEKSKFITSLFYIENEQDITKYMNLVKEKYKNATHYCYAYIIGNIKRFSDDKEPSNTAGMPILNCLEKNNLKNNPLLNEAESNDFDHHLLTEFFHHDI